jgi:hypothetical protein
MKQLHQILLAFSQKDERHRGHYKTHSNSVAAFDENGVQIGIVSETTTPFDTPRLMTELVAWIAGFGIQALCPRHLRDAFHARQRRRFVAFPFFHPLQLAVPRRQLRRRKRADFVDFVHTGGEIVVAFENIPNFVVASHARFVRVQSKVVESPQ